MSGPRRARSAPRQRLGAGGIRLRPRHPCIESVVVRRPGLKTFIFLAVLLVVGVLAAMAVTPSMQWRTRIVENKVRGRYPMVSWGELLQMLNPRAGFWLEPMSDGGRSPYAVIRSPATSPAEVATGRATFVRACATCHGTPGAEGRGGPDLFRGALRRATSDFAMFRTIRYGVADTAMQAHPELGFHELWTLVSFVRSARAADERTRKSVVDTTVNWGEPVAYSELKAASVAGAEWLTFAGSYSGIRHSGLQLITPANVGRLELAWIRQLPTSERTIKTTPIIRGEVMYVTEPSGAVRALDIGSGRELWAFTRPPPDDLSLCCGRVNRGVAILGEQIYVGTLDAHLIALDRRTGVVRWDTTVANYRDGYSVTGAPLALDGRIVTGVGGGDFGARGFIAAYDATTGAKIWQFDAVPPPGQPGNETWPGETWKSGGSATWHTGSFDPERDELFWGVGNAAPVYRGGARRGDNLYSDSMVVVDATSGRHKWHFQFSPNDGHDWDSTQTPMLVHLGQAQAPSSALLWANRNGFYYVFDRANAKFSSATAFAQATWAERIDADGRPVLRPNTEPSPAGVPVYPSGVGATNWWSPSYDPALGLAYVPVLEKGGMFFEIDDDRQPGHIYASGNAESLPDAKEYTAVRALDAATGALRWEYRPPDPVNGTNPAGILTTASNLLLSGDRERLFALDARTGAKLWDFPAGGTVAAGPVTYIYRQQQYVTFVAGPAVLTFRLPQDLPPARRALSR